MERLEYYHIDQKTLKNLQLESWIAEVEQSHYLFLDPPLHSLSASLYC